MEASIMAKANVNDSVFTHLFRDKAYTLQLYQSLHPEDTEATEDSIQIVTLENILLNQSYNDLGFTVGDRLIILVEAQSTWSVNIVVRGLLYMAQTIQTHITDTKQNIYSSRKVSFPEPEFYVLYTGARQERPAELKLSEEFFGGRARALEVTVKMLYDGKSEDILHQYVVFTRIYHAQLRKYGRTQKAVWETIQLCKDQNVLKAYLKNREKEVVDIMMTLFDRDQIFEAFLEEQRRDAAEAAREAAQKAAREAAQKAAREATEAAQKAAREEARRRDKEIATTMYQSNMTLDTIAAILKVSVPTVRQWLGLQPA